MLKITGFIFSAQVVVFADKNPLRFVFILQILYLLFSLWSKRFLNVFLKKYGNKY